MAVPSSGAITMRSIKDELENNNYDGSATFSNISLEDMSDGTDATINSANAAENRPDTSAPHAMSEFYSYDHDISGVTQPTSLAYVAGVNQITFTFADPTSASRVYFYQGSAASFTIFDGSPLKIDGNTEYISVDEAGSTSLIINDDNSNDQKFNPAIEVYQNIDLGHNDFMDISYKGYLGGVYSAMTSDFRGYTLPADVSSMSSSVVPTTTSEYGDGNDGAYTITLSWNAPNGGANSYKLTHGQNSSRLSGANTQDVSIGATGDPMTGTITGVNNAATYYMWVAAVGAGGDTGAYVSHTNAVALAYFDSSIADFTISTQQNTGGSTANSSQILKFIDFVNASTSTASLSVECAHVSGGSLFYAISDGGDPGILGTNFSSPGFVEEGNATTITPSSSFGMLNIRFKWVGNTVTGTINRNMQIKINGYALFEFRVTCRTVASGGKGK
tara:strand:+ start:14 stop:1351 length:1338 start_codon:yes stop_codon:yes gene_type:complete